MKCALSSGSNRSPWCLFHLRTGLAYPGRSAGPRTLSRRSPLLDSLSARIARLEAAAATGDSRFARDCEVIRRFLTRAEGNIAAAAKRKAALNPEVRRFVEEHS